MKREITGKRLEKYFRLTGKALDQARQAKASKKADEILDMATSYYEDARFFEKKGDLVTAFAALNYAHGWLDAGARLGHFNVKDSRMFSVDI